MLEHADGVMYVVKFNTVKRKTAKLNVRRLLDSNTPVFGAILNNINLSISSYYYSNYYDSSYSDYYVDVDESTARVSRNVEISSLRLRLRTAHNA